jgi:HNH endonuclease
MGTEMRVIDDKLLQRLLAKCVIEPNGCWSWTGATQKGYGALRVGGKNGRTLRAYRLLYELHVGPISDGLELDHLCRNKLCINPAHLEPVTHQENMIRADAGKKTGALNRAKTHCANGHPYDDINTYWDSRGDRACRACKREWRRINKLGWSARDAR